MKHESSCDANEASFFSCYHFSDFVSLSREKQGRKGKKRFGADHLTLIVKLFSRYQLICKINLGNGCYRAEVFCTQSFLQVLLTFFFLGKYLVLLFCVGYQIASYTNISCCSMQT